MYPGFSIAGMNSEPKEWVQFRVAVIDELYDREIKYQILSVI